MSDFHRRVLFVNHTASLGGAELMLIDLVRGVREHAHVVLFEEGPLAERLRRVGASVEVLPGAHALREVRRGGGLASGLRALPAVARMAWALAQRARHARVLFANTQKALVVGALASLIARRPLIWFLHDLLTHEHFSASRLRLATTLANRFARVVVCNSEATRRAFEAAGGRAETVIAYSGIDPAPFEAVTPGEVAAVRAELGLSDAPLVGVFSRLAEWKGQHVLLEALAELPDVHALLVGDAPFDTSDYADALRRTASSPALKGRVTFAGFREDVPALIHACDIVAHTSTAAEPFGRVIVEGHLAGKPVIATSAGGAREIVQDGQTGWLVPPGDAAALAQVIRTVVDDRAEAQRRAQAGKRRAYEHFVVSDMQRVAGETIDRVAFESE